MLRSVKNWLTLLFLLVVAIDVGLAYGYVVPTLESRLVGEKLKDLAHNSNLVASNVSIIGSQTQVPYAPELLKAVRSIDLQIGARIVVVDLRTKTILADSRNGQPIDLNKYPVLALAASTDMVRTAETDIGGGDYATAAVPIAYETNPSVPVWVVLVAAPLKDVQASVRSMRNQIALAAALSIVFTLVSGYLASYFIARRLKRIERAAVTIAGGDFTTPVRVGWRDEIGQLAGAFNTMGERLQEAFSEIEAEKENVEALLNDLDEGVIGATPERRLAIANPVAERLLGVPLPPDADLDAILPEEVHHALVDTQEGGEDRLVVFELRDITLEATVYGVEHATQVAFIIVLRDVTEQARLEHARRDFIATASHELKTPLFSLSGFMELIDDGDLDPETEREFLSLMRQQVDRLTDLSLSLLDLSQIDAGTVQAELDDLDAATVTRAIAAEFRANADAHGVGIEVVGDDEVPACADERRLSQILRALIDNAVKFSPEGGHVGVDIHTDGDAVRITVADEGPGIPTDELTHIFERFYQGRGGEDKPGTGLGLAIARQMAELMGGSLTVHSAPGAGAQFVVRLPHQHGAMRSPAR